MTPDQLFEAKKAAKKAARRNKKEEEASLQITSLMDIVSIIVVYLLKSYGDDPVNITPASGQKIPLSRADAPIRDGSTVYITSRDITFEDERIVNITDEGDVDPSQLEKHLITPLFDAMAAESDKSKQMAEMKSEDWEGRLIVIGDQNMKFSTLIDVMYTAGRAEYLEYAFCVIQTN
jgi:biopolymer transport protein ExbD